MSPQASVDMTVSRPRLAKSRPNRLPWRLPRPISRITGADRMLTKIYDRGSLPRPLREDQGDEGSQGIVAALVPGEETKFFPEEISLFVTYANTLSIIIHNMRLLEANAEKIRQLTILQDAVSRDERKSCPGQPYPGDPRQERPQIARSEKVLVYFLDIEKNRCLVNDGGRVFIDDRRACEARIGQTIIGEAIDTNTAVGTLRGDVPRSAATRPVFSGYPSEIALPLKVKKNSKSALYLAKKSGGYSTDQIHVLDIPDQECIHLYDNAIMHSMLSLGKKSLKTEVEKLKEREDILLGFPNILGKSKRCSSLFHVIEELAGHNTNILIQGESGTGKELIARAIHRQSNPEYQTLCRCQLRRDSRTLLESELFGYEAGAFTDARKKDRTSRTRQRRYDPSGRDRRYEHPSSGQIPEDAGRRAHPPARGQ